MGSLARLVPRVLGALAIAGSSAVALSGQSSTSDAAEGREVFARNCSLCHGGDATGGRGPNLARGVFRRATTDARLIDVIQNGIEGTAMPWTGLSDVKASQVVAYIRSLGGGEVELAGDPERGRELFFGEGTCSTCHWAEGAGSRQGPDLTWVGWQRAPDFLRESILDSNAEVEPRWWTVEARTTSGIRVGGVLVDEDQFAIRVLDEGDVLRAVPKSKLERLDRVKISKMPDFGATLSEDDVDDLVAYLAGLRGGSR